MISIDADGQNVLFINRRLKVSPARAYRAFTDPLILKKWWGPRGYTAQDVQVDLRTGGGFRIILKRPEGKSFAIVGTYREIIPAEKLVFTFRYENVPNDAEGESVVTVIFEECEGGTELRLQQVQQREIPAGKERGWLQSFERLAETIEVSDTAT